MFDIIASFEQAKPQPAVIEKDLKIKSINRATVPLGQMCFGKCRCGEEAHARYDAQQLEDAMDWASAQ